MQALGLQDIGVIYEGEHKNSISLGYFLRQKNALRRKTGLEEKGYEPMMRVQRQSEPRYWLDYEQTPGSSLLALDMQSRANDFMQRAMPCPDQPPLDANSAATGSWTDADPALQIDPPIEGHELQTEDS